MVSPIRRSFRVLTAILLLAHSAHAQFLITTNSTWRYFKGTSEASTPTNAWRAVAFDDSAWPSGAAPFHFGTNSVGGDDYLTNGTILSDMRSNYTCIFLRQPFVVADTNTLLSATFGYYIEDGLVAWLNGVEFRRAAVGSANSYTNTASSPREAAYFTYAVPTSAFLNGTNVLAIQAFIYAVTNDDFRVATDLRASFRDLTPPVIVSLLPAAGSTVTNLLQVTVTFSETVTNVDAGDLLMNGVPATSVIAANPSFTFRFARAVAGPLQFTWAAAHGITDLATNLFNGTNATWSYTGVVAAPTVQSVTPAPGVVTNLTQVVVTFNAPAASVDALDLLMNGQPALSLSGSNVTYTFSYLNPPEGTVPMTWDPLNSITDLSGALAFNGTNAGWTYSYVDTVPPVVVTITPTPGITVGALAQVEVIFSEPVSGVDAADLLMNGQPATGAIGLAAGPYVFQFPQPPAGAVQFAWATDHNIYDLAATPNRFAGGSWTVTHDPVPFTGDVILNEFLAANVSTNGLHDEDGELQEWIELYNRGTNNVRLFGWALTDDSTQPGKWVFPDVNLAAGQYLVVFASAKDRRIVGGTNRLHTNFKLNTFGDYLALFNAAAPRAAATEFAPQFPEQRNDYSFGLNSSNQWRYFRTPTPGAPNGDSAITQALPPVHFSVERGFFNAPCTLILSVASPGATIRYTTDGSLPTETVGSVYSNALAITTTTTLRAAAFLTNTLPSLVQTHTYLFLDSVILQPASPAGFPITTTWTETYGWASDYAMDPKIVTNPLYSTTIKNDLLSLPTLSIVMKTDDMFGAANGLYTHATDTSGKEVACSVELINPDGRAGFQSDAGIRMHGGGSRARTLKHPFRVAFKGKYGPASLHYQFFPDSPVTDFDTFVLRADYNNAWTHGFDVNQRSRGTLIRDACFKDVHAAMGALSSHSCYVHLYINGLYWGVYNPAERPDAGFAASYLGGDKAEYDSIVANDFGGVVIDGDNNARNFMLNINNLANPSQYELMKQYLDIPQYIDYMILLTYGANLDWGNLKNWYTLRRRQPGSTFKYMCWDDERTMEGVNDLPAGVSSAASLSTVSPDGLQAKLVVNPEYRVAFGDRVQKHFFNGGALTTNALLTKWLARSNQLDRAVVPESARWGDSIPTGQYGKTTLSPLPYPSYTVGTPYTRNENWLGEQGRLFTTYFPVRGNVVLSQFRTAGLFPNVTAPSFSQYGGRIPRGFNLSMSATNGTIFFTTNGMDPRVPYTGAVNPAATAYNGLSPVSLLNSATVRARVLSGTNWSALVEAQFTVEELVPALRVTEIMYNPPGGDAYEFIELKNIGGTPLDLGNYYFEGITFVFPARFTMDPNEIIVLASGASPTAFQSRYPLVPVAGWYSGHLSNGGERINLRDPSGRLILSVQYDNQNGWPPAADGFGYSLEIINANGNPDDPANWRAGSVLYGTPGYLSPPLPAPAVVLNEIMADNVFAVSNGGTYPDWIELYNRSTNSASLTGWSLSNDGNPQKFVFPDGITLEAGGYLVVWCDAQTNAPGLHTGFPLGRKGENVFLFDPNSNRVDAVAFGLQVPDYSIGRVSGNWQLTVLTPGAANQAALLAPATNLVINEWLADPPAGGSDWLELYNRSAAAPAALDGSYLGTSNALFQIKSLSFVAPGGFVQLFADQNPGPDHLDLNLPKAGGLIVLYDNTGAEVERVTYGPQLPNVSQGRLPNGSAVITNFLASVSPGASNYILAYTGPVLNEVMARNQWAVVAPWGSDADWVELVNPNGTPFDLSGMGLSDSPSNPNKWVFPAGTSIGANGFLVIWCDGGRSASTNLEAHLNTGFALNGQSGGVYLFNALGQWLDAVEYGFQIPDLSIGRNAGPWVLLASPTPGAPNAAPATLGTVTNLCVNEWLADSPDGVDWFELYNRDPLPVDMTGLYLTDNPSLSGITNSQVAPLSFIGGRSWVVWKADGQPSQGRDHANFQLNAAGETIRIYSTPTNLIDAVDYGWQTPGVSQGRWPDGSANFASFPESASPGDNNYLPLTNVVINEVLARALPPLEQAIELFNAGSNDVNLSGWYLSDVPTDLQRYQLPPGTILFHGTFVVFYEYQFNPNGGLAPGFALNGAHGDQLYLSQAGADGNLTGYRAVLRFGPTEKDVSLGPYATSVGADVVALSAPTFGADHPGSLAEFRSGTGMANAAPRVGPVVINEVMYHPIRVSGGTVTEFADEEFLELHNISSNTVPLFDPANPANRWKLSGAVSFTFPTNASIGTGEYVLVVHFDPLNNLAALTNFLAKYAVAPSVQVFGPWSGRLDNAGESVELYKPDAPQTAPPDAGYVPFILMDRVVYAPTAPWPTAADGGGASLQRLVSSAYGNDPVNWKAETPTAGRANVAGVVVAPTISAAPQSQSAIVGRSVMFAVTAGGTAPLSYQWRFNSNPIAEATNATYLIAVVQTNHQGSYNVQVSNAAGSMVSLPATLTVLVPPIIYSLLPPAQEVIAGDSAVITVDAGGTLPLSYQWLFNGSALPGNVSRTLTVSYVQPADAGDYQVVVTNVAGGATSTVATLTVLVPPVITGQPQNLAIPEGSSATFRVSATGTPPLYYHWYANSNLIAGATNATLTLASLPAAADGSSYLALVSNSAGTAPSAAAVLTVWGKPILVNVDQSPDGLLSFTIQGQANRGYFLDNSTNLVMWTTLRDEPFINGETVIVNTQAAGSPQFYRARLAPQ